VVLGCQIGNSCVVPCLSENTYLLEGEDGLSAILTFIGVLLFIAAMVWTVSRRTNGQRLFELALMLAYGGSKIHATDYREGVVVTIDYWPGYSPKSKTVESAPHDMVDAALCDALDKLAAIKRTEKYGYRSKYPSVQDRSLA
jgi:hypothetical protein